MKKIYNNMKLMAKLIFWTAIRHKIQEKMSKMRKFLQNQHLKNLFRKKMAAKKVKHQFKNS